MKRGNEELNHNLIKKNGIKVAAVLALSLPSVYVVSSPSVDAQTVNNSTSQAVAFTIDSSSQAKMHRMSGASRVPSHSQPPVITKKFSSNILKKGSTIKVNLLNYFNDPDSSYLGYSISVSKSGVVNASISGAQLTIKGLKKGSTSLAIKASDGRNTSTPNTLHITVK